MSNYLLPVECSLYFRKNPTSLNQVPASIKISGKNIDVTNMAKWYNEEEFNKALGDISDYAKHKRNAIFGNILAVEGEKENDGQYSYHIPTGAVKITLKKGGVHYQNIKMKPTKYRSSHHKKSKGIDVDNLTWDDDPYFDFDKEQPKKIFDVGTSVSKSKKKKSKKSKKNNDVMREKDVDWDDVLDTNGPKKIFDDDFDVAPVTLSAPTGGTLFSKHGSGAPTAAPRLK